MEEGGRRFGFEFGFNFDSSTLFYPSIFLNEKNIFVIECYQVLS